MFVALLMLMRLAELSFDHTEVQRFTPAELTVKGKYNSATCCSKSGEHWEQCGQD